MKGRTIREPRSFTWRRNFVHITNSVEDYAKRWAKSEKELDTLSELVKSIRYILKSRIKRPRGHMKTIYPSVFNNAEVRKELDRLHDQYLLVPADKASYSIVFFYKAHHINCIFKELGFDSTHGNPTYTHSSLFKQELLQNHKSVMDIFNIPNTRNEFVLPYLYWIPELHKSP